VKATLAVLALLFVPTIASAADVPVSYTVDDKNLKNLALATTPITFELYTDAACSGPIAHTEIANLDNVDVIARLKRLKPKQAPAPPPKTADLRHVLTGVTAGGPFYLRVTGTGVTPINGACQAQVASASAPVTPKLVVKDSNGAVLGPLYTDGGSYIILDDGGTPVATYADPATGYVESSSFLYTSTNCSGPQLYFSQTFGQYVRLQAGVIGTTVYYAPSSAPVVLINSVDSAPTIPANCTAPGQVFNPPDRCCCTSPTCYPGLNINAGPVSTLDVSAFVPPFTAVLE
jgi:hypothetical protein